MSAGSRPSTCEAPARSADAAANHLATPLRLQESTQNPAAAVAAPRLGNKVATSGSLPDSLSRTASEPSNVRAGRRPPPLSALCGSSAGEGSQALLHCHVEPAACPALEQAASASVAAPPFFGRTVSGGCCIVGVGGAATTPANANKSESKDPPSTGLEASPHSDVSVTETSRPCQTGTQPLPRTAEIQPGGEEDGRRRSMVESVRSPAAVPRRMRSEGWGTNPRPSKWRGREARDRVQADPPRRMQSDGPDAGGGCGLPQVRGAIAGGGAAAAEVKLLGLVAALSRDREPGEVSGVGGGAAPKGASLVGTSGSSVQSRGPSSKEPMRRGGAATSAAEQLDANNGFVQLPSPAHRRDFEASATVADSISQWSTNLIQVDGKDKNSNSEGNGCSNGSRGQHVTFAVTPWSSLADKRVSGCAPPILNHGGSKLEPEPGGPPVPGVPVLREPVFSSAAAGTGSGSRLRRVPGLDSSGVRRSRSDVGPAIPERPW